MKPSLLIADGDAELRDVYRKFITERGYQVETASDGLDCLAKLRRAKSAALLLDLDLRWGGGDGVLARLREEEALSGIPVILTATAGYRVEGSEVIGPPVVQFLPKPFGLTVLLESIGAAVAKGQAARKAKPNSRAPELRHE
jgi:DNA-binding NtrC family response regulator